MRSFHVPAIRCQRHSQLDSGSTHSMLISLLRGLAALQVAAAHLRAEVFPGLRELADPPLAYQLLAFCTAFAHQAVVVFFLISGWLVGGSLLDKFGQPGALRNYAIDRATRLWAVLVPALLLMLAIGAIVGTVDPARADLSAANDYSIASFAGNLAGLQTVLVEPYAGNYALWSLSNETWYYVQFPLLLLAFAAGTRASRLAAATALVAIAAALPGEGTRGNGNFPCPVQRIKGQSPLWDWSEVAAWLEESGRVKAGSDLAKNARTLSKWNLILRTAASRDFEEVESMAHMLIERRRCA